MTQQSDKDRVVIFDTTLRDGEQSPGATMTHEEKLDVAELLDQMGVDIIEAGCPIAPNGHSGPPLEGAKRNKKGVGRGRGWPHPRRATAAVPPRRSGRRGAGASTPSSPPRRCT